MPYNTRVNQHLSVRTHWARLHDWPSGRTWNFPPLPVYVLWLVKRGAIEVMLDGKTFQIKSGEVFLHPPAEKRFITIDESAEWLTLGFEANLYGSVDLLAPLAPVLWKPKDSITLQQWMTLLVETERVKHWEDSIIHQSLACAVVGWCWKELGRSLEEIAQEFLSPWLRQVLDAMRREPQASIQEHIANSGYSPAQFRRHFKQAIGCSPQDYVIRIRMEQARHLLETTSRLISEIASEVGFTVPEHFTRLFKKTYGVTPSHFRQMARRPQM